MSLPQLETEEDLEQILADAGEGDTTDGTTDDDESAISTDISEADTDSNIMLNRRFCDWFNQLNIIMRIVRF
jgi:hypothetical protein